MSIARRTAESPFALLVGLLSLALIVACAPQRTPAPNGMLEVEVRAGPVCPVEQEPPEPGCEPRAVANAPVFVQPADGRDIVVAEGRTDADGHLSLELPAGDYLVLGGDVEGLFGRPEPVAVTVAAAGSASVSLIYDTGIR